MKTAIAIFLLGFWAASAPARLGETVQEIRARYGEPVGRDLLFGMSAESHNFKEYNVMVVFKEGKSFIEALKPLKSSNRIGVDQALMLAGRIANCGGWSTNTQADLSGFEFRGTNGVVAILRRSSVLTDSLVIYSSEAAGMVRGLSPKASNTTSNAPAAPRTSVGESRTNAVKNLKQQAINGSVAAQRALGKCYWGGDGVPKDEQLARYWLEKAAAKGDKEAEAMLKDHLKRK